MINDSRKLPMDTAPRGPSHVSHALGDECHSSNPSGAAVKPGMSWRGEANQGAEQPTWAPNDLNQLQATTIFWVPLF